MTDSEESGLDRRTLLAGIAGASALSACSGGISIGDSGAGGTASAAAAPLATADADKWAAAVGSRFDAGGYILQLAGIERIDQAGRRPGELRQQAFVAVFDIVRGGFMPGDLIYRISHATIPAFNIFLANSVSSQSRMHAFFN
jgi:hypothetical protein